MIPELQPMLERYPDSAVHLVGRMAYAPGRKAEFLQGPFTDDHYMTTKNLDAKHKIEGHVVYDVYVRPVTTRPDMTEWFMPLTKPHWPGVYEVWGVSEEKLRSVLLIFARDVPPAIEGFVGQRYFAYWTGSLWCDMATTVGEAAQEKWSHHRAGIIHLYAWRGYANPTAAQARRVRRKKKQ